MLLTGYTKDIFRAECNPSFETLHCIAHLHQDVGEVIPYLNSVLGGAAFFADPPAVTFKVYGKLITVHADKIAVNGLKDEAEADKILQWLMGEINSAWENRAEIEPSYQVAARPQLLAILKLLPRKTGCRACGQPTCMAFAALITDGAKGPDDCSFLSEENKARLAAYLADFNLDR
ncbi:MAG: Fe-S cluster protein [Deltaproteobacteria bacterium]|nr:Fe-S cluster protein [Deltaproteobacteria bacterium]